MADERRDRAIIRLRGVKATRRADLSRVVLLGNPAIGLAGPALGQEARTSSAGGQHVIIVLSRDLLVARTDTAGASAWGSALNTALGLLMEAIPAG